MDCIGAPVSCGVLSASLQRCRERQPGPVRVMRILSDWGWTLHADWAAGGCQQTADLF